MCSSFGPGPSWRGAGAGAIWGGRAGGFPHPRCPGHPQHHGPQEPLLWQLPGRVGPPEGSVGFHQGTRGCRGCRMRPLHENRSWGQRILWGGSSGDTETQPHSSAPQQTPFAAGVLLPGS